MVFFNKVTQKDVEQNTLIDYLRNEGVEFDVSLIDLKINEPTDVRYNNTNYQITIGDQEAIEARRKASKKDIIYQRGIINITHLLLNSALTKKINSSDSNATLLIEVSSTGALGWEELESQFDNYALAHPELRGKWKEIYAVFEEKNIKLYK